MSQEHEARNTSAPGVWPGLGYQDARAGLRFLTEVLGFTESLTVDGGQGRIAHAELLWPEGGGVMFGSLGPKDTPGTAGVYVVTADPDSVHERAVEAARPSDTPRTTPTTGPATSPSSIRRAIPGPLAPMRGRLRPAAPVHVRDIRSLVVGFSVRPGGKHHRGPVLPGRCRSPRSCCRGPHERCSVCAGRVRPRRPARTR